MAGQENQQYTVLYGRLSQEDERAGESNSIQHQRTLLEKYAKEKGFENTIFLADDGYSGTNFERPSWKKIVEMIEAGQVANLIVKDASRLGREYLQVGYYMEIYFPQKNVLLYQYLVYLFSCLNGFYHGTNAENHFTVINHIWVFTI